jgi:hypothetical protein
VPAICPYVAVCAAICAVSASKQPKQIPISRSFMFHLSMKLPDLRDSYFEALLLVAALFCLFSLFGLVLFPPGLVRADFFLAAECPAGEG